MKSISKIADEILKEAKRLPPKDSNWREFAEVFNLDVSDLDKLAKLLGDYKNFTDLDVSISPGSIFTRDKSRFIRSLKSISPEIKKMKQVEVTKKIKGLWSYQWR